MNVDYSEYAEYLECPACSGCLDFKKNEIECKSCANKYEYRDGIPALIWEEKGAIPVSDFLEFYNKPETIKSMNLRLEKNAASRRMYLIEKYINRARSHTYLELSAGSGITTRMALQSGAKLVFSLDISTELLLNIKKLYGEKVIQILADARSIPVKNSSIDLVLNSNLIEHIDLWEKSLKKTLSIAKKYAIISTDTYSIASGLNFCKFGSHPAGHLHIFNHFELKEIIRKYGTIEKTFLYTFYSYNYKTEKANLKKKTDVYGVGGGKKVFPATPPFTLWYSERGLKKILLLIQKLFGKFINYCFLDLIETDSFFYKIIKQKNYLMASMYIVKK
jgi:ubiquinone/menaquinone biosynthesis C-methylase UbiE/uncharacterized protein YbaR (Trm112 family)